MLKRIDSPILPRTENSFRYREGWEDGANQQLEADQMAYDELLADMESMVEITPEEAECIRLALLGITLMNPDKDCPECKVLTSFLVKLKGRDAKD